MTKLEEEGKIDVEVRVEIEDLKRLRLSFPNLKKQLHYSRCKFQIGKEKKDVKKYKFYLQNIKTQTPQMSLRYSAFCNEIDIDPANPDSKKLRRFKGQIFKILPRIRPQYPIGHCELPTCKKQLQSQWNSTIGCKVFIGKKWLWKSKKLVTTGKRKKKIELKTEPFWICSSHKDNYD